MKITRVSIATGKTNMMDLPITNGQLQDYYNGVKVQDAFPHLSADEREFLISGITPDEWDELYPPDED